MTRLDEIKKRCEAGDGWFVLVIIFLVLFAISEYLNTGVTR